MKVTVKLFAAARDVVGASQLVLDLPEGATVANLRVEIARQVPDLSPLLASMAFAQDADYVADEEPLRKGAEIACIPPVSGG